MEKQKSFSNKPIRFLVFSFTVSFSVIFLIFFPVWVIKSTTPFQQEIISENVQVLADLNRNSSTEPIFAGTRPRRDEFAADFASSEGSQKRRGNDYLSGNLSFTSFRANLTSGSVDISNKSRLSVDEFQELGHVSSKSKESQDLKEGIDRNDGVHSNGQKHISKDSSKVRIEEKNEKGCDITKGRWVFEESFPLYTNVSCPFIDEGFNCLANGRKDKDYMKWRWQPLDCDIPRFNATKMLELIRGKRLVFVGDSLNRNQWESMLCLLKGAVVDPKKVYETRGRKITKEKGNYCFKFVDYQCTVEYYATHFIVHESKARIGKKRVQTLRIDTIDKGSSRWRRADILVFNTAHWWTHHKTKAGINYYQEHDQVYPRLDVSTAFQRALTTWASWVDKYINPRKTKVFFRSSAPSHFSGGLWNAGGHCKEAFRPVNETFDGYPEKNVIVEEIIRQMKTPVTFLNITRISDYRVDGHPSIYGRNTQTGKTGVQDCSHWCLPGVPDTWNQLLYFYLQPKNKDSFVML
ncbi:trichome birefringence-like 6 [Olea europaea subsp. europaea]|uniref:Trichome birefringence-like 6 n=2 Tax=Olea europaea subsp. europaea TaxID=158383 RepID=A0A8S0S025_OLEEU|nr:trichome birefringence-like 6 [Olea europaea subsp. europaea]